MHAKIPLILTNIEFENKFAAKVADMDEERAALFQEKTTAATFETIMLLKPRRCHVCPKTHR